MTGRRLALVGLVVVLIAGAAVAASAVTRSNEEDIFLEAANSVGPNPFTTTAAVTPTSTTATTSVPAGTTTTALFGGSGNQKVCDPEALIMFLTNPLNAAKGNAWVGALNADPTLKWSGGTQLTVNDIPTYIRELTPTFLAADTRVTNHSFKNGKAVPHQSVLQKGTAVLVDRYGVPRARCACGNPLLPPKKVRNPHYHGDCWIPETTTTTRRTTTTTTSTSTSTSTSTTIPSTQTTTSTTTQPPGGPALGTPGGEKVQLIFARHSNRCGNDPYCSPPGCVVTTTTEPETTTTSPNETTTTIPSTETTRHVTGTTTRTTLKPTTTKPPTTITIPQTTPTTIRPTTTIPSTQTTQGGKP
jgi:hypothetical protein